MKHVFISLFYRKKYFVILNRNFTYSKLFCSKDRIKKINDYALAPHFESKLRSWQKLIEIELKARSFNCQKENLFLPISNLKFKATSIRREVKGTILDLKILDKIQLDKKDKIFTAMSMIKKGSPIVLTPMEMNQTFDANNNFVCSTSTQNNSEIRGIMLDFEDDLMQIKLIGKNTLNFNLVNDNLLFNVKTLNEYFPYYNLLKLLTDRKSWKNYPGYNLLLYIYRAKQFPTAFNDKNVSLPKEFNSEQQAAVNAAINSKRPIINIQGPPGTGKTKVIVEIIAETIRQKKKILVCAPSHKALMNVLYGCQKKGLTKYCKIHGEDESNTKFLTSLIESHPYYLKLQNFYNELNDFSENEEKELKKVLNKTNALEQKIQKSIAENTRILFCTISCCSVKRILELGFMPNLTIVEEAGQSMECETWPMLFQAPRAIIVGDHNQIPPLVISKKARAANLSISLTEWLMKEFSDNVNFKLRTQYRSNPLIQRWSNQEFYNSSLKAHPSCNNIKLNTIYGKYNWGLDQINDLNERKKKIETEEKYLIDDPLVLVNTDLYEKETTEFSKTFGKKFFVEKSVGHSAKNIGEAWICAQHIKILTKPGKVHPALIGCITPYLAQTSEIESHLPEKVLEYMDISSVDAFQGQEREVIVMSFVRNNKYGSLGFLDDIRRLNVAITRAKCQFFLVASVRMMKKNEAIKRLYEVIKAEGRIVNPLHFFYANKQK